jgi:hypothetical protein
VDVSRSAATEKNRKGNKERFRYVEVKTLSNTPELFRNYEMENGICK